MTLTCLGACTECYPQEDAQRLSVSIYHLSVYHLSSVYCLPISCLSVPQILSCLKRIKYCLGLRSQFHTSEKVELLVAGRINYQVGQSVTYSFQVSTHTHMAKTLVIQHQRLWSLFGFQLLSVYGAKA